MNKIVEGIREALKPHHVEGFTMCFPMPNLQQMEQLMKEVERLESLADQKEATILALSLKAESWETATRNARSEVERLTADNQFLHQRRGELVIERDKARSEVDGNVLSLAWTCEKPRTQGHYWLRVKGCDGRGYEVVKISANPKTRQLYVQEHGDKHWFKLAEYGGPCEWYGPITLPA